MRKTTITLGVLAVAGFLVTPAVGQPPQAAPKAAPATAGEDPAIRQAVAADGEAFNKGDLQSIAANWAPDAEYVDEVGNAFRGRETIAAMFRKYMTDLKGSKMNLSVK